MSSKLQQEYEASALRRTIANMWIERVPVDEAIRILGVDVSDWTYEQRAQALYCWKMDMLEVTEDKHLPELLRLEQHYLQWSSKQ